jgi:hypothetical protein
MIDSFETAQLDLGQPAIRPLDLLDTVTGSEPRQKSGGHGINEDYVWCAVTSVAPVRASHSVFQSALEPRLWIAVVPAT